MHLEDEEEVTNAMLQQTQCMNSKGKSINCMVNSDMACISTELVNLVYDNIEKIRYLGYRLYNKNIIRQIREKGTNETLLILDIKGEEPVRLHANGEMVNT